MSANWKLTGVMLGVVACTPDVVSLPEPTGTYAVGRTREHWVDDTRDEIITPATDDVRELTVYLWYPVAPNGEPAAAYVEDLEALEPVLARRLRRAFERVSTHATDAAPVADEAAFPLLVFSPGNDMLSAQYTAIIEDLVSHGFVVAALDHPHDARAVVLESGEVVAFAADSWPALPPPSSDGTPDPSSAHALFYRERVGVRAEDVSFVIDRLTELAPTDPVASHVDFERIGLFGHSVGGVAAGEGCQIDARIDACLNLDGDSGLGPFYLDDDGGFDAAYMTITKTFAPGEEQLAAWGLTLEQWQANLDAHYDMYFGSVRSISYRVVLDGAQHDSFTDDPYVIATLEREPSDVHERHLELVRRYALAFFSQHLLGVQQPILDPDAEPGPNVTIKTWMGS
jgi:predicted dienelactone hydrolase